MASAPGATAPLLIERADIHKSCKSLEVIISLLANYTEAANALATIQKRLSKALKDAASVKGTNSVPASTMMNSAGIFENLAEVDAKFVKILDKETENVGSDLKKWFKKLTKEEKAHDERIAVANAKIKQAGQMYEKKAKRKDRDVADEHGRYVAVLNSVGPEMSKDKYEHGLLVSQRHTASLSGLAASLARLAEAEWVRACEHVRRSASVVGAVGQWRVLCEGGWSGSVPGDLPDLTDRVDRNTSSSDRMLSPPELETGANNGTSLNASEYLESPTSSSSNSKLPSSTRKSSEGNYSVEHSRTHPTTSRPSSPPPAREPTSQSLEKIPPKPESKQEASAHQIINANTSSDLGNADAVTSQATLPGSSSKPISEADNVGSDDARIHHTTQEGRLLDQDDLEPEKIFKPETNVNDLPFSQDMSPSKRDLSPTPDQIMPIKKLEVDLTEQVRERHFTASSENVEPKGAQGKASAGQDLDRRVSVESSMSSHSLVATMRERYGSRPTNVLSPPPRDLPRPAQKVSDLATRYTPLDISTSSPRSGGSATAQSGSYGDHFPTFRDRYPRSGRDNERYKASPALASDQDHFDNRDNERYRYLDSPAEDRNRFHREDRDQRPYRSARPPSPDRPYYDELGVRDQLRRVDSMEKLMLREREANLREQERRLEIERRKLASAREAGYASDTSRHRPVRELSPYEAPRRSESPGPITSQQSLPPYDHSPNCGCQRCSARHYASTPSLPRSRRDPGARVADTPIYKPEPPILLRPEKPMSWLRRLSMPVVPSSDKRSPGPSNTYYGPSGANIVLPEEDGRIRRRSFEHNQDRETSMCPVVLVTSDTTSK
ncbi:hypothetical protein K439DRAFT_1611459 [Ramaria rubella]|nr:hypothetical protein K439DRAFT_1611459 [Ramaria rubella]